MKILQKICFVLLLTIFLQSCSSTRNNIRRDCFMDKDVGACRVKAGPYGSSLAQYYLGEMYFKGKSVSQDYKEAVKWWKISSKNGYAKSQFSLGWMYVKGQGVLQDYKEAVKWYVKAAEQGHANAQNNLGGMYGNGQGVPQDYVMAHMYANIAAVSGNKQAIKNREIVENKMTALEISKAQDLAKNFIMKVENRERELDKDMVRIERHIRRHWVRPPDIDDDLTCTITLRLLDKGKVSILVLDSSGNDLLDRSVIDAVEKSSPLPSPKDPINFLRFRTFSLVFSINNDRHRGRARHGNPFDPKSYL